MEEQKTNETLRSYQEEILAIAKQKNIISYLETGSGKTNIAIELIRFFYEKSEKESSADDKRYFAFLAPTNILVDQQYNKIKESIKEIDTIRIKGSNKNQLLDEDEIKDAIKNIQILVMTPQIFMNLLIAHYIDLKKVKLLIIDECHHHSESDVVYCYLFCLFFILIIIINIYFY